MTNYEWIFIAIASTNSISVRTTIKLVKCSNIIAKTPFIMERQLDIKIDTNKVLQCSNIIAKGLYVYRETNRHLDRYN